MTQIPNIAEETKEKIKRSSAYSLPNNPTGAGYKPQDIKNALFKPIVDSQNSVLAEIEKLINELNKVLPSVKIREMKLSGKDNTLQLFDENMQEIAAIDLPFVKLTDFEETTKNIPNNIALILNETNYRLKAELSSQNGVIAQSNEIDLPIESLVVGAQYLDGRIILLLKNGASIDVELTDLIRGLVNETDFELFQNNINGEIGNLQNGISSLDRYATENINDLQDRVSDLEQNSGGSNITVEQEVNDSTNPVSSKAVKNEFGRFSNAYDEIIRQAVVTQEYFYNGDTIITAHNKDYHASEDITNLTIQIGTGISSVMFKIVDSGDFNIEIMGCNGYIGKAPDFKNGETWELNIHNGIIASGKVVSE